jgi:hypothetical protein
MPSTDTARGKPVRLTLTPAEHDRLRVLAAQARVPMSEFVRQLVRKEISGKPARGP